MNAKETERIIAFHGARRGAARIRAGADGTRVALTLRPAQKGAPVPTAICLAGTDGRALRVPLAGGSGGAAEYIDPAVILLIADSPAGEVFCGEGARGTLERRAIEGLKQPLRALRRAKAPESAPGNEAEAAEKAEEEAAGSESAEAPPPEPLPESAPENSAPKNSMPASGTPESSAPASGMPAKKAPGNGRAARRPKPQRGAPPKGGAAKKPPAQRTDAPPAAPAEPRSEALRSILLKAEELFPAGGMGGTAESHFASDAPLPGAFIPRPIAPEAERQWQRRSAGRGTVPAGRAGQIAPKQAPADEPPRKDAAADPAWRDAVRELSRPEAAPKPAGVGTAEAAGSLFPDAFPDVRWRRVRYPGTRRYYLEGTGQVDGVRAVIYALPGESYPPEPYRGRGFTRFVRDVNGHGYWVKVKMQR